MTYSLDEKYFVCKGEISKVIKIYDVDEMKEINKIEAHK